MTLARKADLAKALGVNRSAITRAAQAGRLVPASDASLAALGWYEADASLARFAATRGGRLDLVDRHAAARAPVAPAPGPEPSAPAPGRPQDAPTAPDGYPTGPQAPPTPPRGSQGPHAAPATAADHLPDARNMASAPIAGPDRAAVRGQILAAENAITKLEIAISRGQRLHLADVGRESQGWGQRLADHLLRVIDQVAARLAAVPDPAERQRLLRPELRRVHRAFDQAGINSLRALKAAGRPTPPASRS